MSFAIIASLVFAAVNDGTAKELRAQKELTTTTLNKTLWQTIGAFADPERLTKEKVEKSLGIALHLNGSGTFATCSTTSQSPVGHPIRLTDGVIIESLEFFRSNKPYGPNFLVLSTKGACVTLDKVRNYYSELKIRNTPHGHSLDEVTSYTTVLPWSELSFRFSERNRDCLSAVALKTRSPESGTNMD